MAFDQAPKGPENQDWHPKELEKNGPSETEADLPFEDTMDVPPDVPREQPASFEEVKGLLKNPFEQGVDLNGIQLPTIERLRETPPVKEEEEDEYEKSVNSGVLSTMARLAKTRLGKGIKMLGLLFSIRGAVGAAEAGKEHYEQGQARDQIVETMKMDVQDFNYESLKIVPDNLSPEAKDDGHRLEMTHQLNSEFSNSLYHQADANGNPWGTAAHLTETAGSEVPRAMVEEHLANSTAELHSSVDSLNGALGDRAEDVSQKIMAYESHGDSPEQAIDKAIHDVYGSQAEDVSAKLHEALDHGLTVENVVDKAHEIRGEYAATSHFARSLADGHEGTAQVIDARMATDMYGQKILHLNNDAYRAVGAAEGLTGEESKLHERLLQDGLFVTNYDSGQPDVQFNSSLYHDGGEVGGVEDEVVQRNAYESVSHLADLVIHGTDLSHQSPEHQKEITDAFHKVVEADLKLKDAEIQVYGNVHDYNASGGDLESFRTHTGNLEAAQNDSELAWKVFKAAAPELGEVADQAAAGHEADITKLLAEAKSVGLE